ncbi:trimeric intracellular cation channel family protein [Hespellia stercorisuis]|uniref:Uncharacterized membrane protein YeiH n=1 Tax=Hespellia stercorisuis DSM 15480 TaxID=1121950 RepID=A0A1M6QAD5_9FIRM|nr:trimeric intracellular cation channel family protein [Hespellia stercorisuis]SHK17151.1 Uncharacterized membrane protein YeiH [Hespellia stercorisuis DSM 15480]
MEKLFNIMELLGIIAFTISGAMVGIEKKMDLFGVMFLGITTAFGGGIIRDIMLGNLPPAMFESHRNIEIAAGTALLVFIIGYLTREYYSRHLDMIETINNVFDAVGLGIFTTTGIQIAINTGYGYNKFLLVCLGMITGVGGGLLRDIIAARTPVIFAKHIYAVASIVGGMSYLWFLDIDFQQSSAMTLSILVTFIIRILSTVKKWNLPRIN